MSHPFLHPKGKGLLKRVAQAFESGEAYVLRDSKIIFVCGGPRDDLATMRYRFCDYAKTNLTHLRMFHAEDAEKDYVTHDKPEFHNVAKFEDIVGEISDCVVIFPESPGSFAELGYFAQSKKVRQKTIVAHNITYQSDDSFIIRGPVALIDTYSQFKPAIQIDYGSVPDFSQIKKRIEKRITGKNRKRFLFTAYSDLDFRLKFFAIFELVRIFGALTLEAIAFSFKSIFKHANLADIKHLLSILVAAKLITREGSDHQFFCAKKASNSFMEFDGFDSIGFRLELYDFYAKNFPDIDQVLKALS